MKCLHFAATSCLSHRLICNTVNMTMYTYELFNPTYTHTLYINYKNLNKFYSRVSTDTQLNKDNKLYTGNSWTKNNIYRSFVQMAVQRMLEINILVYI